jgi:steroid delta-isomerase-like uncharacterized protein
MKENKVFLHGYLVLLIMACTLFTSCGDSSKTVEEKNKSIVRYIMEEGVDKQNIDKWDEVLTPDYKRHSQSMPEGLQEIEGIDTMKSFLKEHFKAFPDWTEEIKMMIAEDDKVAYITTARGTHTGAMGGLQPTNKKVELEQIIVHRLENEKIAETWIIWDNVAFLRQLGLFPEPQ